MLDPSMYSGPEGFFIRHSYGKVNKVHAAHKNSDLHFTLCYAARHIRSMNASDLWNRERAIVSFEQSLVSQLK